jgi:hypothetical protein
MSRKKYIVKLLEQLDHSLSCLQICNRVAKQEGIRNPAKLQYLPGSVASKLIELTKAGTVKVSDQFKSVRGGKMYFIKKDAEPPKKKKTKRVKYIRGSEGVEALPLADTDPDLFHTNEA